MALLLLGVGVGRNALVIPARDGLDDMGHATVGSFRVVIVTAVDPEGDGAAALRIGVGGAAWAATRDTGAAGEKSGSTGLGAEISSCCPGRSVASSAMPLTAAMPLTEASLALATLSRVSPSWTA